MPIDDRTTNRSYQLPNAGNLLVEDAARLRAALQSIDADIFARYTKTEVDTLINDLIQGAPGALDTLNELAAALGDDPNFATTVTNQLALKANAADVYTKAQADARYVQGQVQTEMVFIATANQSVFTLTTAVINKPSALVSVDGVVQPTAEYSLNQTGTQLTLSEGVPAGTIVRVLALGVASEGAPADDTVTEPKLRTGAVSTRALAEGIEPVVASINNGPLAGFRNAIINGNFNIWQRGTSFTNPANFAYVADRWQIVWNGSGAARTVERVAFPLGQTDVPGEPAYMLRFSQTVAGSGANSNSLVQRIEGVRAFAGQQVTVSFHIKATALITLPAIQFIQRFGTGGSPSSQVFITLLHNVSITTAWQRIQVTVTVPSISGKTIGDDDNDNLAFEIKLPVNATFSVDIAQVQVEPGPVATPFERRPIGTELALCQRYYQERSEFSCNGAGNSSANGIATITFPVDMRAAPTVAQTLSAGSGLTAFPKTDRLTYLFTSSATNQLKLFDIKLSAEL